MPARNSTVEAERAIDVTFDTFDDSVATRDDEENAAAREEAIAREKTLWLRAILTRSLRPPT